MSRCSQTLPPFSVVEFNSLTGYWSGTESRVERKHACKICNRGLPETVTVKAVARWSSGTGRDMDSAGRSSRSKLLLPGLLWWSLLLRLASGGKCFEMFRWFEQWRGSVSLGVFVQSCVSPPQYTASFVYFVCSVVFPRVLLKSRG